MKKVFVLLAMVLGATNMYSQSEPIKSIDLGLSVKWANMNVGAENPRDPGGYYACGETRIKTGYGIYNYFPNIGREADVALTKWKYWRMPTREEINELMNNCKFDVYETPERELYCKVTGPNGNSIILPLPGYIDEDGTRRKWLTNYWGSGNCHFLYNAQSKRFDWGQNGVGDGGRNFHGCLVRPVTPHDINNQKTVVEHIDELPKYQNGELSISNYMDKHLNYPIDCLENRIEGDVEVSFIVETDGSLSDIRIENSTEDLFNTSALRAVKNMGKWTPGRKNGTIEAQRVILPIKFNIQHYRYRTYGTWVSSRLNFLSSEQGKQYLERKRKQGDRNIKTQSTMVVAETNERVNVLPSNGNEHGAIDLGLSVYWANCNIGASSLQEYGYYFSWGETNKKNTFTESTYQYYNDGVFKNIGDDIAKTNYDAAHVSWGEGWRMPTKSEFEELIHKCKWIWTIYNGVKGYKVVGTNGNSIFLPAAGQIRATNYHWIGERGYYWTSTVGKSSRYAYYLVFAPFVANGVLGTESDNGHDFRYWGYLIRPVRDKVGKLP